MLRPTWAEIDLEAFQSNLRTAVDATEAGVGVLAVIKADAYGCGALACAAVARDVPGVEGLAVATPDEALELRDHGISDTIVVLGPTPADAMEELVKRDVSVTVTDIAGIEALGAAGRKLRTKARAHLKVDTGMSRLGLRPGRELGEALAVLGECPAIDLEGVFTHFASSDEDEEYTRYQLNLFRRALEQVETAGLKPRYRHAANSAAIMFHQESHFDLVRPGIMLYGSLPGRPFPPGVSLRPVLSWKTRIAYIKTVPAGTSVGYGRTYVTDSESVIATLPVGYADGYPRSLSNSAPVLIAGKRLQVAGRVCMDQLMVDVGNTPCGVGDEVTLIGDDGVARVTVDELARLAGTIPHEILTGIGKRVPRVYRWRGRTFQSTRSLIETIREEG